MPIQTVLTTLFPNELTYEIDDHVILGSAATTQGKVNIIGTVESAAINQDIAIKLAKAILQVIETGEKSGEKTPVVFIVDTQGQALSRADELLCLNRTFAHLAACVELLRQYKHPNFAIIFGEAVSGGFLSYGLMANQVFALATSQVKVMDLNAMSRVTKIPVEQLKNLSQTSAIFAPGAENFYKMGALNAIWHELDPTLIEEAISYQQSHFAEFLPDTRRKLAQQRAGRVLCDEIIESILSA